MSVSCHDCNFVFEYKDGRLSYNSSLVCRLLTLPRVTHFLVTLIENTKSSTLPKRQKKRQSISARFSFLDYRDDVLSLGIKRTTGNRIQ